MNGSEVGQLVFRKSSYSDSLNDCVEIAVLPDGGRVVRDSKNPEGSVLTFTGSEFAAFTAGVRGGEFDR